MICPDWTAVTAWRRDDGVAPPEWRDCLEHLAACADCRRRVADLDPTLLLAAAVVPAPQVAAEEVEAIAVTVRSLVASERLAARSRPGRRALLGAAALVVLLAAPLGLSRIVDRAVGPMAPPAVVTTPPEPAAEPPVEVVQPAGARVYQFGSEELPVVLIFDENLDL